MASPHPPRRREGVLYPGERRTLRLSVIICVVLLLGLLVGAVRAFCLTMA